MGADRERSHSYRLEDLDASAELRRLASQVALLALAGYDGLERHAGQVARKG
mgnify:CR=1 FL=1